MCSARSPHWTRRCARSRDAPEARGTGFRVSGPASGGTGSWVSRLASWEPASRSQTRRSWGGGVRWPRRCRPRPQPRWRVRPPAGATSWLSGDMWLPFWTLVRWISRAPTAISARITTTVITVSMVLTPWGRAPAGRNPAGLCGMLLCLHGTSGRRRRRFPHTPTARTRRREPGAGGSCPDPTLIQGISGFGGPGGLSGASVPRGPSGLSGSWRASSRARPGRWPRAG